MMNHQSSVIIHQSSIINQSSIRDQSEINQRSLGINLTFFCHQVGRMKVAGAFDKCIRRRILRSFICDGSRGLILSKNNVFFKKLSNFGTFWESKIGKKVKCLMKWVRIAPNLEILIPIDAPQVWDLKNAGFG